MESCVSPALRKTIGTFGQIIIAGGDEETSPAELFEWVHPVLAGIPAGLWLTCEITAAGRGCLTARIRRGTGAPHLALCCTVPLRHARPVCRLLPVPPPTAVILLNDHAAQVMTLLDGMAAWLNVFEIGDPAVKPIMTLLAACVGRTESRDEKALRLRNPVPGI